MDKIKTINFIKISIVILIIFISHITYSEEIQFVVKNKSLHKIDSKIFGHFLEKPSWGGKEGIETGIEAAVIPGTHKLQPKVIKMLKEMKIPILRFPGGGNVYYLNWCDMIDMPDIRDKRPISIAHGKVTNNFGYDEFLNLCKKIKAEPLIVVNFADGLLKKKNLKEAANHAAALVAYCNSSIDADLPKDLKKWPLIRKKNGRKKPYGVRYFQIGNETWFYFDRIKKLRQQGIIKDEKITDEGYYINCLSEYISAMRSVDPSISIIIDGYFIDINRSDKVLDLIHKKLGKSVDYLACHTYMPGGIGSVRKDGKKYPVSKLTAEEVWKAWVSIPQTMNNKGESVLFGDGGGTDYLYAITEWNWTGWWEPNQWPAPLNSSFAKGIGAAGYLHAFMRAKGGVVKIACQTIAVGNIWGVTSIRVDPKNKIPAYFMPTGQVTMLYSKYHGDNLLKLITTNIPTFKQPLRLRGINPRKKVAYIDALVTANKNKIYFHAINRHFSKSYPITIDLSDFKNIKGKAINHLFQGRLYDKPKKGESREIGYIKDKRIRFKNKIVKITLPKRSISCVEIFK
jgi:alpha-N-arabinofuranosidase